MQVIDPGHQYVLYVLDSDQGYRENGDHGFTPGHNGALLTFVKREGSGYPGNVGHYPGTTMQEALRALIHRAKYVNAQIPCEETGQAIEHMRRAIELLELRAARRHGRTPPIFKGTAFVEYHPTCPKCGHIGCEGTCH
jgi:hypothetical protein